MRSVRANFGTRTGSKCGRAPRRRGFAPATDRGVLKHGMWADIVIFDPEKVHDLATYAEPNQLSVGMDYVFVNGVPVIADGKMTNALPGKILYGPGYTGPR